MKIRIEMEVKNCEDCLVKRLKNEYSILSSVLTCNIDNQSEVFDSKTERLLLPCDIRPCPIEVK